MVRKDKMSEKIHSKEGFIPLYPFIAFIYIYN